MCLIVTASSSCKKYDNYPEPAETLTGTVTDVATGKGVQTESGGSGTRIKMMELSWSDNPTPYYFSSIQDGSFNNTKIFKGNYNISVEGPFVPIVLTDATGNLISDKSQTLDVSGTTTVNFQVEPFLNVEWVGEPVYNAADGTVTVNVRYTRGTANPNFQLNVSDIYLFVSQVPYVANNNKDDRYSRKITYSGTAGNNLIGQSISITTNNRLPTKRDLYFRVGARVSYGLNYYNYTDIKTVTIP